MILADFQETAVSEELLPTTRELLRKRRDGLRYAFKSPTGSGKTVMIAELLRRLAENHPAIADKSVFVWASVHDLHRQSREKLARHLGSLYNLIELSDLRGSEALPPRTILFVNWESLTSRDSKTGKWKNLAVLGTERDYSVPEVFEATRDAGLQVVMIVDESHTHLYGTGTQHFIAEFFQPKLTFEVSATPVSVPLANEGAYTEIDFDDVVDSKLIREATEINPDVAEFVDVGTESDEIVLEAALAKRATLQAAYAREGAAINPLVLIQLPSEAAKMSDLDKSVRTAVEEVLGRHGITYDNGRLALWLADSKGDVGKRNLKGIEVHDSPVDVLIFKQAAALGWDCPRAQVLVMLRNIKSLNFEIQTVGRIIRMPQESSALPPCYFASPELNRAYVYTNMPSYTVTEPNSDANYFLDNKSTVKQALLRQGVAGVRLPSYYVTRAGNYGDLGLEFELTLVDRLFRECGISPSKRDDAIICRSKAAEHLDLEVPGFQLIISDRIVRDWDRELLAERQEFEDLEVAAGEGYTEDVFNALCRLWTFNYVTERSYSKIRNALYTWSAALGLSKAELYRVIACSTDNQEFFQRTIREAQDYYREHVEPEEKTKQREQALTEGEDHCFELPNPDYLGQGWEHNGWAQRYSHEPCYLKKKSQKGTELPFMACLDASKDVAWWYQNRDNGNQYFAIRYAKRGDGPHLSAHPFYPDFIVCYASPDDDDTRYIGIYDTKGGFTARGEEAEAKATALHAYVQYVKGDKDNPLALDGGLVVFDGKTPYIHRGEAYRPYSVGVDGWERFAPGHPKLTKA